MQVGRVSRVIFPEFGELILPLVAELGESMQEKNQPLSRFDIVQSDSVHCIPECLLSFGLDSSES